MGLSAELYQVSEEERQKATADQYSEKVVSGKEKQASDAVDFCERAKFVPMRLTYDERKYLRLIDATMHVGKPRIFHSFFNSKSSNSREFNGIYFKASMGFKGVALHGSHGHGAERERQRGAEACAGHPVQLRHEIKSASGSGPRRGVRFHVEVYSKSIQSLFEVHIKNVFLMIRSLG